jgi:hypothetical protein
MFSQKLLHRQIGIGAANHFFIIILFMKAEIMYQKGLKIAQSNAVFLPYEGQLLQSLSLFYLRQRQVSNAKKYLDLGLAVQKQLNNEAMIPVSLLGYGQYYELIHLPNQARLSYEKGLKLAKNVKSVGLMIEFSKELYRMHKAEGNSEQALYYLNLNLEQNALSKKEKAKEALFRKTIERNILEQEAKEKNSEKITSIYLITSVLLILILLVYFIRRSTMDHEEINLLRNDQVDKIKLKDALALTHQKLAKNALEAIEEKGQIDINLHRVQKNNIDFIEIALYDDGIGIKEQQLEQIFEPYVTTKIKGTGLGLAIVKKIIEEHGGAIWVDASRKIGAGFIIQLPAL